MPKVRVGTQSPPQLRRGKPVLSGACSNTDGLHPLSDITIADIQNALIWTRHYGAMVDGDYGDFTKRAAKSWQSSRGYPAAEALSSEQMIQLVSEGLKERDKYGWAMLTDSAVGFSVGFPTSFATSTGPPREENGVLWYRSNGVIGHRVIVDATNCTEAGQYMSALVSQFKSVNYHARKDDWFVISGATPTHQFYIRSVCRPTGTVTALMSMPFAELDTHGFLFVAMTNNLVVQSFLNPTGSPSLRLIAPPLSPTYKSEQTPPTGMAGASSTTSPAAPADVERSGKTNSIRLVLSDGAEQRPRDVFDEN
ncbi:hypothetical protein SAMN02990966_06112 [Rhodospirillales bacterium URHD0017]|nr:hypothetical protein SAMN02990966_06112 [Rhodospirillales bacterium URHD0017]